MKIANLATAALISLLFAACGTEPPPPPPTAEDPFLPPAKRWGEFFEAVQMGKVFPDGKTFVDCTPKFSTDEILSAYEAAKGQAEFHLKAFVLEHFELPKQYASGFTSDTSRSATEHINVLWPVLTREPSNQSTAGTLIPLPGPYIVPGGRFGEIYYWDSYFTMLGLSAAGQTGMIRSMVDNFAYLIDTVGFIPNGNRDYFLTRSQPPFFAAMVELLAEEVGDDHIGVYLDYLPHLEKEYAFWMNGMGQLSAEQPAVQHVVRLDDGSILNRYWDAGDYPREEMHHDDVETAKQAGRPAAELYRDLRSACESGWDFSSRWFADPQRLETVQTTQIIPVDLNALLYNLERQLARAHELNADIDRAQAYLERAEARRQALLRYCWDEEKGFFQDYNFVAGEFTGQLSLAGLYPLFFEMALPEQARSVAAVTEHDFLRPGGLRSTLTTNGQQWDAPNGWAPLQWIAIRGLRNYGQVELANEIKQRWVALNTKVYKSTGKMVEKYNVENLDLEAGGGEYPVQDGFGWTNGVLLRLLLED